MRLAFIITAALTMGMLHGCAAQGQGDRGQPAYGSYDDRQRYPAYRNSAYRDPAYDEGQRSQALEGNTR